MGGKALHRSRDEPRRPVERFPFDRDPAERELPYVISPDYQIVPLDFTVRSEAHPCPYLAEREAREQVFKAREFPPELYHDFMNHEFRRAGLILYRPMCQGCWECRPLRVPVVAHRPSRSHRRILRKNIDLNIRVGRPKFSREKFRLYQDYLSFKHDTSLCDSPEGLRSFLYTSPVQTLEFEYHLNGSVIAVSIADVCSRSLSSVYAFYSPDHAHRSLGTFSALQEMAYCRALGIPHYYLGFCVQDCPSMNYKSRYRPHEILDRSLRWREP